MEYSQGFLYDILNQNYKISVFLEGSLEVWELNFLILQEETEAYQY